VAQAGQAQVVRQARIGSQGRGVGLEVEEVEFLDAQLVLFEHDEGLADVVEAAGDQAARFAAAADQVEILAVWRTRRAKRLVVSVFWKPLSWSRAISVTTEYDQPTTVR
jgi:hypothetical protein